MPEWFCNRDCSNFEDAVDQKMGKRRTAVKEIEDLCKRNDLKSAYRKIQELTKYQNPKPIVRAILTPGAIVTQDHDEICKITVEFYKKLFTETGDYAKIDPKKIVDDLSDEGDIL